MSNVPMGTSGSTIGDGVGAIVGNGATVGTAVGDGSVVGVALVNDGAGEASTTASAAVGGVIGTTVGWVSGVGVSGSAITAVRTGEELGVDTRGTETGGIDAIAVAVEGRVVMLVAASGACGVMVRGASVGGCAVRAIAVLTASTLRSKVTINPLLGESVSKMRTRTFPKD
jgi:hypothetical protein